MKINFTKVECVVDFDGNKEVVDVAKYVGNHMKFMGSKLLDIGFEDLAREIYYSEGEVEVTEQYAGFIWEVIAATEMRACIKRALKDLLNIKK